MTNRYQLFLMGPARILLGRNHVKLPEKAFALFALLLLEPAQRIERKRAASFLWEVADQTQSLVNLRQLLSRIKRVSPELINTENDHITSGVVLENSDLSQLLAFDDILSDKRQMFELLVSTTGRLLDGLVLEGPAFQYWHLCEQSRIEQLYVSTARSILRSFTLFGKPTDSRLSSLCK